MLWIWFLTWMGTGQHCSVYRKAKNWINGTSEHHLQWKKYEKNSLSYRLSLKTTGWTVWNSSDRRVDSLSLGMWDMDMSSCQPFTNLQVTCWYTPDVFFFIRSWQALVSFDQSFFGLFFFVWPVWRGLSCAKNPAKGIDWRVRLPSEENHGNLFSRKSEKTDLSVTRLWQHLVWNIHIYIYIYICI